MRPVGSILPSAVRDLLQRGDMSQGKLEFAWKAAVGPAIGRATEVRLLDGGRLEVHAEDATWRRELKRTQAMILARLQELLGAAAVKSVKIVGPARGRCAGA